LWVPGVDHAGIATQNVVEKKLAKENKTRWDLGREKFLEEVWRWKNEHGDTITRQLRRLGASCDWTRERFTMDEGLSRAVREAFVTLYERGLIYRGNYIINWCPRCQTALSDEEAAHKDVQGGLYHIIYPIAGKTAPYEKMGADHIVVATTRPETMLGDTAVAVHPGDARYRDLIGKNVLLPLMDREIPVIADEFVDPEFGTGIVKVTPAHDPNDFQMGHRHGLEQINVMTPDGKMNERAGSYAGMDRFEARKKILRDLEEKGLFLRRDSHLHAVGHCYRCDTVVEPYLSKQWFVKMQPLAEKALKAHEEGKTVFYPDRWTKVYTNWLKGIRDWCISRQIWWGHQIPAWHCTQCQAAALVSGDSHPAKTKTSPGSFRGKPDGRVPGGDGIIVAREEPSQCPACGSTDLKQDPDVLDTWFSSWLWPFSTLGWPENTGDLKKFYPTSDLITAPEIIFFWVARMIMAGLEFMGEVPFTRINIHGTVRAASGLKMSKSLGNSIDPLEVINEMGADALRYSMIMLSAQDVYLSREKFEVGRNFTNKVWNACRFVLRSLEDFKEGSVDPEQFKGMELSLPSRWILSRLEEKTAEIERHLSEFGLAQATSELYHFVWDDFCDWYIELAKTMIQGRDEALKLQTRKVLFFVCERILRLLHPFMPFVTEEVWHKFKEKAADGVSWPESIMLAAWPHDEGAEKFRDPGAQRAVSFLQDAVRGIRDLRARFQIAPANKLKAVIACKEKAALEILRCFEREVKSLARLESLECVSQFKKQGAMVASSFADFDVYILVGGILDLAEEKKRVQKKIAETEIWIQGIRKKLDNPSFASRAPAEILEKEKEKLNDAKKILISYQEQLAGL